MPSPHAASLDSVPPDVLELIANRILADVSPFFDRCAAAAAAASLCCDLRAASLCAHDSKLSNELSRCNSLVLHRRHDVLQLACNLTAAGSPGTRLLASHLFAFLSPRMGGLR